MLSFKARFSCWSPDSRSGLLAKVTRSLLLFVSLCEVAVPLCSVCWAVFSLLWLPDVSAPWVTRAQQRWLSGERCMVIFGFLTFVRDCPVSGAAIHKESLLSFLRAVCVCVWWGGVSDA